MRYLWNGLLIMVIGGFGPALVTSVPFVMSMSISIVFIPILWILSLLGFLLPFAACIWAGYDSAKSLGMRASVAGVYGGLLVWLGYTVFGKVFWRVFPGLLHSARQHRAAHPYPTSYIILGWLIWLAIPAGAVFLAWLGASWAQKRLRRQTDTEAGFDPEIDQEPGPYVDRDQPREL